MSNLKEARLENNQGWPEFDAAGHYIGPLIGNCGHNSHPKQIVGLDDQGKFKTSAAAAYPSELCNYSALLIVRSLTPPPLKGGVDDGEEQTERTGHQGVDGPQTSDDDEDAQPRVKFCIHSMGDPIQTDWAGDRAFFNDGFGLCSPMRWHPSARGRYLNDTGKELCGDISKLLDNFCHKRCKGPGKTVLSLALGKLQGMPFSDQDLARLRKDWFDLLP